MRYLRVFFLADECYYLLGRFLRQCVLISSHRWIRFFENPYAHCLALGQKKKNNNPHQIRGSSKGLKLQGSSLPSVSVSVCLSVCLSVSLSQEKECTDVFVVEPSANNLVSNMVTSSIHGSKLVIGSSSPVTAVAILQTRIR